MTFRQPDFYLLVSSSIKKSPILESLGTLLASIAFGRFDFKSPRQNEKSTARAYAAGWTLGESGRD